MTTTWHQMKNILDTYGQQARRGRRLSRLKSSQSGQVGDNIRISSQAKRKRVVERVSNELVQRLADPEARNGEIEREILTTLNEEYGQPLDLFFDQAAGAFLFQVREDGSDPGQSHGPMSEEEAKRLNRRLREITRQLVDQTMI